MNGWHNDRGTGPTRVHRDLLQQIVDRDARAPGDPFGSGAVATSSATSADRYHVFLHWRTARAMVRNGWLRCVYQGGRDEGEYPVYELTAAGRAIAQEAPR